MFRANAVSNFLKQDVGSQSDQCCWLKKAHLTLINSKLWSPKPQNSFAKVHFNYSLDRKSYTSVSHKLQVINFSSSNLQPKLSNLASFTDKKKKRPQAYVKLIRKNSVFRKTKLLGRSNQEIKKLISKKLIRSKRSLFNLNIIILTVSAGLLGGKTGIESHEFVKI